MWPREFQEERWETAELIKGHVLNGRSARYTEMGDYNGIKREDSLTVEINGQAVDAVQWVHRGFHFPRGFEQQCNGNG